MVDGEGWMVEDGWGKMGDGIVENGGMVEDGAMVGWDEMRWKIENLIGNGRWYR